MPDRNLAPVSASEKVKLFRALFRGRDDVYAVRWQAADGRSGYSPASQRDWESWYAASPADRKKVDRETRRYLPLTDEVVEAHLRGKVVVGIYPLLADESCRLLAADFDKTSWREDALAFLEACDEWNVPASLEGRDPATAYISGFSSTCLCQPYSQGSLAPLSSRGQWNADIRLASISYDRFFPNQDTMPKGGFGNLIALPLQREARNRDNSVFVGRDLEVFPDQWEYLRTVRLMQAVEVERIVEDAQRKGDVVGVRFSDAGEEAGEDADEPDPWTLPPSRRRAEQRMTFSLPSELSVVQAGLLFIEKAGIPAPLANRLLRLAAFQNPELYKAQSMRLSTYGKPRVIACGLDLSRHIAIPRGCLPEL